MLTLSLVVLLSVAIVAFMVIVRADRQSASLTAAGVRADLLGRSAANLVLADLISEIREGSTNLGSTNGISYLATAPENMLPQRRLAAAGMTTNTNFHNLYKQSVPGPAYEGTHFAAVGPARVSEVGTWEASRNRRVLSAARWNGPALLSGPGFTSTNELPRWIYFTRHDTQSAAQLNPTNWSPALALAHATNSDRVIGRVAYNVYETGGCLDLNVAGGPGAVPRPALMGSLAGATLTNLPGADDLNALVSWRNAVTAATADSFRAYASTNGPQAGFLGLVSGDRRFTGRQELIAYCRKNPSGGLNADALPYLTHFSRGLDRPSAPPALAPAPAVYNGNARPTGLNPPPLTVRHAGAVTPDGSGVNLEPGDPVVFRRFPLRRLALITDSATATRDQSDPIYRAFGLYRSTTTEPWKYDHGSSDRILRLDEVRAAGREPDFFEMLQAAMVTGSLGGSIGPDNFALPRQTLDENIAIHVLQIGANLIDQYDGDDFPTEIGLVDQVGTPRTVIGIENLPYINEIPIFYYRPAALPRTLAQGWMQFEVWNPHQNAVAAQAAALRIVVNRGVAQLRVRGSGAAKFVENAMKQYPSSKNFVIAGDTRVAPARDFSATPGILEFTNGSALSEPKVLGPGAVNGYPVESGGTTTPGSIVVEATPATPLDDASEIRFAGIKVGEVEAPDDRVDGVDDQMAFTVPAPGVYPGFTFEIPDKLTIEAQVFTPQGWKTYQRLDGFDRVQANLIGYYQSSSVAWVSGIRPRNTYHPQMWSGWVRLGVSIDPRTTRFNWYDADSPNPGGSLRPDPTLIGSKPGAGTIGGEGWSVPGDKPFGLLAANIPVNPITATDNIFYSDPDGVVRRADGEERGSVPAGQRVFPLGLGRIDDRPRMLNRPFESVGDMGYAFRDQPWKTLDFHTAASGDGALLDFFTVEETPLDSERRPLRAGVLNPNSASSAVLAAVLERAVLAERGAGESASTALSAADAATLATALRAALDTTPVLSRADLTRLVDDPAHGPGPSLSIWRKTEKEALIRALAPISEPGTWNVCIDLIAQTGRFPPNAANLRDFVVQGEARFWVFAAIDRATGTVIDTQFEIINE